MITIKYRYDHVEFITRRLELTQPNGVNSSSSLSVCIEILSNQNNKTF